MSQQRGKVFPVRAQVATQGSLRTPSTRREPGNRLIWARISGGRHKDLGLGVLLLICMKPQGFEKKHCCLGPTPAEQTRSPFWVGLGTVYIDTLWGF